MESAFDSYVDQSSICADITTCIGKITDNLW